MAVPGVIPEGSGGVGGVANNTECSGNDGVTSVVSAGAEGRVGTALHAQYLS
jgi:hypothetical protein